VFNCGAQACFAQCEEEAVCVEGYCTLPDCGGNGAPVKECGGDGVGGSCGQCPEGLVCAPQGVCCTPDCEKKCGADGCGGICPGCTNDEVCLADSTCCRPLCEGVVCGPNGCGGVCGECENGLACKKGQCTCKPQCDGKSCGPDGCDGDCGTCGTGSDCDLETGICSVPEPPAAPDCESYCAAVMSACVGDLAQYASEAQCISYCAEGAKWPVGTFEDENENTIGCRMAQVLKALELSPAVFCGKAGATGGNVCGTWCINYCGVALQNCTTENELYPNEAECFTACVLLPTDGATNALTGDSVQCRIQALGWAGADPLSAADFYCPSGSPDGVPGCVDESVWSTCPETGTWPASTCDDDAGCPDSSCTDICGFKTCACGADQACPAAAPHCAPNLIAGVDVCMPACPTDEGISCPAGSTCKTTWAINEGGEPDTWCTMPDAGACVPCSGFTDCIYQSDLCVALSLGGPKACLPGCPDSPEQCPPTAKCVVLVEDGPLVCVPVDGCGD